MKVYAVEFEYVDAAQHGSAPLFRSEFGPPTPDEPGLFFNFEDAQAHLLPLQGRRDIRSRIVTFELRRLSKESPDGN